MLLLLAREIQQHYECVLIIPQDGMIAQQARSAGIQTIIQAIPLSAGLYLSLPNADEEIATLQRGAEWSELYSLLERERPDYVLVNTAVHPLPALAAQCLGITTLWLMHEILLDTPYRAHCAAYIALHCDVLIGVSEAVLRPFLGVSGVKQQFVLSPFIEQEALAPKDWAAIRSAMRSRIGWDESHRVVGFIAAAIYPNKGLLAFIESMIPIAGMNDRARFLIVGSPVDLVHDQACRQVIVQSGYEHRFAFLPFVDNISHLFPTLDIVAVPSIIAEGFGLTALEGLTFGRAVVAFASGGLVEIMRATGNGDFLVQTGNTHEMMWKVRSLLASDRYLEDVGNRNREAAVQAFGIHAFRRKLQQLVGQLPVRAMLRFTLVRGSGPAIYAIEQGRKRPFASVKAMIQRGFQPGGVAPVSDLMLSCFPEGEPLPELRRSVRKKSKRLHHLRRRRGRNRLRALRRRRRVSRRTRRRQSPTKR